MGSSLRSVIYSSNMRTQRSPQKLPNPVAQNIEISCFVFHKFVNHRQRSICLPVMAHQSGPGVKARRNKATKRRGIFYETKKYYTRRTEQHMQGSSTSFASQRVDWSWLISRSTRWISSGARGLFRGLDGRPVSGSDWWSCWLWHTAYTKYTASANTKT